MQWHSGEKPIVRRTGLSENNLAKRYLAPSFDRIQKLVWMSPFPKSEVLLTVKTNSHIHREYSLAIFESNSDERYKTPEDASGTASGPQGSTPLLSTGAAVVKASVAMCATEEMALIRRIIAGETDLFYDLLRPYQRMLFLTAVSIVQVDSEAEEVVQEAVFKAFKNISSFRGEAKFSTWLVQITINEAKQTLRRQRRAIVESLDAGNENDEGGYMPMDFADWREIPSECLERKELRRAIRHAIGELRPIYRDVLMLRDVHQMSVKETAKALGISEASVKTRLLRARLQMRDALAPGIDGTWTTNRLKYKTIRPF
jgi:RNA polymerase sigma-70 factor (ECF subfamily)